MLDRLTPENLLAVELRKGELSKIYLDDDVADRVSKLIIAVERDVIPRLIAGRSDSGTLRHVPDPDPIDNTQVVQFVKLLIGRGNSAEPSSFVADVMAEGISTQQIYLGLLAPAARHVGAMWDDDLCTFVDVTLALGTLHRIMLSLNADFQSVSRRLDFARRVLLVQQSEGTHTFGLHMVAEFFKRGGWSVDLVPAPTNELLGDTVSANWFTVVGFSVSSDPGFKNLAETIQIVRQRSTNQKIGILVGGTAFLGSPGHVDDVGADGMAIDAIQAVIEAERFVLSTI